MAVQKACKQCKAIYEGGNECSKCGSHESTDSFKGKITLLDTEKSEVAQHLNIKNKGMYAIKLG